MKENPKITGVIFKCLKDPVLLNELKKDPKKLIEKELNIKLPASFQVEVLQETPEKGYIVLPAADPMGAFSEEELGAITGGRGLFCTARYHNQSE